MRVASASSQKANERISQNVQLFVWFKSAAVYFWPHSGHLLLPCSSWFYFLVTLSASFLNTVVAFQTSGAQKTWQFLIMLDYSYTLPKTPIAAQPSPSCQHRLVKVLQEHPVYNNAGCWRPQTESWLREKEVVGRLYDHRASLSGSLLCVVAYCAGLMHYGDLPQPCFWPFSQVLMKETYRVQTMEKRSTHTHTCIDIYIYYIL